MAKNENKEIRENPNFTFGRERKTLLFCASNVFRSLRKMEPEIAFPSHDTVLLTGSANKKLAYEVGNLLRQRIADTTSQYPGGEYYAQLPHSVVGKQVIIIQPMVHLIRKTIKL
jgi:hypothetical protein